MGNNLLQALEQINYFTLALKYETHKIFTKQISGMEIGSK